MKKHFLIGMVALNLLTSCEEDINLTVAGGESKIVIEGNIENGKPAEVFVTRNSSLTQAVNFSNILVENAKVYVSNGGITDTLKLALDSFATIPLLYKGSSLIGVSGQTYNLTVIVDGKTYTATTTIPALVALDSVWWKPQPPQDTLGYAWGHLTDPPGTGNAYKWFAKTPTERKQYNGNLVILNRRFLAPLGSTFDDKFIDGKSFDFAYNKTPDPTEVNFVDEEPSFYYNKKDTIFIKFCSIDYKAAKFYVTYESAMQTNGNPFASPVSIISNISKGGLGVWAGFGAVYDTILPTP